MILLAEKKNERGSQKMHEAEGHEISGFSKFPIKEL